MEDAPRGANIHTSYTHLIQGDLAPIGRVHLVTLGPLVGDEESRHFLTEMDADSNMGAKQMRVGGRRGPFKSSSGRSRIMDRSAHITYRRRGHTLEITIIRGVTPYELDTLIGKLSAHRISTVQSHIFFIDSRKKKLGDIDRVDFEKLRHMIEQALDKRRQVGVLLVDTKQHGVLHKAHGHEMHSKVAMRGAIRKKKSKA